MRNRPNLDGSLARIDHPFPLGPPHPTFFGSRTRHASAPARRRFPSPPSPLHLPCVSDTTWHPLSVPLPSSPTRYIFPTSPTKLMYTVLSTHCQLCFRKAWIVPPSSEIDGYLVAHASQFTTSKLIIFDLGGCRVCVDGWHWGKDCLIHRRRGNLLTRRAE